MKSFCRKQQRKQNRFGKKKKRKNPAHSGLFLKLQRETRKARRLERVEREVWSQTSKLAGRISRFLGVG